MKQELQQLIAYLSATERLPKEKLQVIQEKELAKIIEHHYKNTPHFFNRLQEQKLKLDDINSLNKLKNLMPFKKKDIQLAGKNFYCKNIPKEQYPLSEAKTSGSTGEPVTTIKSRQNKLLWAAAAVRDHMWYNRDYTGRLMAIRNFSGSVKATDNWGIPMALLYKTGKASGVDVTVDVHEQLKQVNEFQPSILLAHSSIINAFADIWEKEGYNLSCIKHFKNVGDTVTDDLRKRIRNLTSLEIEDNYSSSELGAIAIQCKDGLYHTMDEYLIVEVLNEDDTDCKPGEMGRVVITDLYNYASPMIRYDIGDYAIRGTECTCGRHLSTLERVVGRQRNLFYRKDGSRFWPRAGRDILAKYNVNQFQVIQHSLDLVEYKVVTDNELTLEQILDFEDSGRKILEMDCTIKVTQQRERFPVAKNGKFEECICLIK